MEVPLIPRPPPSFLLVCHFLHRTSLRQASPKVVKLPRWQAKAFQRWVTKVVLPSIRRTGVYAGPITETDGRAVAMEGYSLQKSKSGKELGLVDVNAPVLPSLPS